MSLKKLQDVMSQFEQADCPVTHHFSDGIYARELFIPEGTALVGARHKTNHMYVMLSGECVVTVDGKDPFTCKAGFIGETKAGTKKAFYAVQDSKLISFHVTEETDVENIGNEILFPEQNVIPMWSKKYLGDKTCG